MEEVTLGIALVAGLLSFLSPCVLPLVPAYVSYMGGRAVHQVSKNEDKQNRSLQSRLAIFIHGLAFVLGFTFVFVSLGLATTALAQWSVETSISNGIGGTVVLDGSQISRNVPLITEIISRIGGIIIVFFGLHFMGTLRGFFAWLRKNPQYLENFPILLMLMGLVVILALWGVAFAVLQWTIASLLIRILALVILIVLLVMLYTRTPLGKIGDAIYEQRESLGTLPTTIMVVVLSIPLFMWAFGTDFMPARGVQDALAYFDSFIARNKDSLTIALPATVIFILVLFLGRAFDKPQEYWTKLITGIETALYTDTRRDINPTASSSLRGSFIMGVTFSAGWTPCIGPIYGAILQLGLQGEVLQAGPLLLSYSLGLGIPFLLTAVLLDGAQGILRRLQRYMGKIELFTGTLLIFIGVLVASGQLQSLSQNLTPEQTNFSINIEECGTGVAQGHIRPGEFGACMNDTVHPVAIGQGISDAFGSEKSEIVYVISIDEAETIDVDLARIDGSFPGIVTVFDDDGNEIASSSEIMAIDERNYRILENVELSVSGRYRVIATRTDDSSDEFEFRLTIRHDDGDVESETGAIEIETVGGIEDIASSSDGAIGLDIGDVAPNFEVTTISGETTSLEALRGQIVLINFWGTWCGPCIREMPDLQEVYEQYGDEGFTILALATRGDTETDVIDFRDEHELTFTLIVDEGDVINDRYGVINRPSTFVVDQNGVIVFRHFGPVVETQIAELLDGLMEG